MRRPRAAPYRRADGTYWARIRYTDESGKTRVKSLRAANQAEASTKSDELVKQYEVQHGLSIDAPTPITFNKFADLFIPHIKGQQSYNSAQVFLRTLRDHFGDKQLTSITYSDIQGYAEKRRKTKSLRTGKKFKTASINREIALLSSIFKRAIEQGFAAKNPYQDGTPLINPKEETRRDRVLSKEEEEELLAVCTGRRAHLRAVIIAALDTGSTKGELLRLTWGDIHIGLREIKFRSRDKKLVRKVAMTDRLAQDMLPLYEKLQNEYGSTPSLYRGADAPLFQDWIADKPVFRDFKSSFSSACRAAEIEDLRFNDLKRTWTRRRQEMFKRWTSNLAKAKS
jgi:integrase